MKHTIMCSCGKLGVKCKKASEGLMLIRQEAKKEVFSEIFSEWAKCYYQDGMDHHSFDQFKEILEGIEKRHLSTFQEKSDSKPSDNNNSKKDCYDRNCDFYNLTNKCEVIECIGRQRSPP